MEMFGNRGTLASSAANATVADRMAFLRKVYGLFLLSLCTTVVAAFISPAVISPAAFWPLLVAYFGTFIFAMVVQRKPGWNLVALFSFTTVSGLTLGPVMVIYDLAVIQEALVLTVLIFGGLTVYVMGSKRDFSFLGGFLLMGILVIIVGGLLNAFVFQSSATQFMLAGGGVILFSGFVLYDTSNILRRYDVRDYTGATLALYLDFVLMFRYLLMLLGGSRD